MAISLKMVNNELREDKLMVELPVNATSSMNVKSQQKSLNVERKKRGIFFHITHAMHSPKIDNTVDYKSNIALIDL